jgi:urea carboxylase
MWNTFHASPPWLLRFFDQIRFYEVGAKELLEIREDFPYGGYPLRIEETEFRLRDYHAFLDSIRGESAEFKGRQQTAFEAERDRWARAGADQFVASTDNGAVAGALLDALPEGCRGVCSPVTASVWNIAVETGQRVQAGQRLMVLEAMKMEIAVSAPSAGTVEMLNCALGTLVNAGQRLVTLRQEV